MNAFWRLFVALPLPPAVVEELRRIQQALQRKVTSAGIKWVRPEQIHLTLRFLGDVNMDQIPALEAAMRTACLEQNPLSLIGEKLGGFPSLDSPKVIWWGLGGDLASLRQLHQSLAAATSSWGVPEADREFHPHLTLARVKAPPREAREMGERLRVISLDKTMTWQADRLELIRSQLTPQGPNYSVLATVNFPSQTVR